jgi:hypothetical protein
VRYLLILMLAGCAAQGTPPTAGYLCTDVRFVAWSQVDSECRKVGTQAKTEIYGCASLEAPHFVIAPQPRDMNDEKALYVLGHEIAHNLGGKH